MSTPKPEDEREALARIMANIAGDSEPTDGYRLRADRVLAAGWRRVVPVSDEAATVVCEAIRLEQKRIAALPDQFKVWTKSEGRAWQNGMSNAARIARNALEAAYREEQQ